MRFSTLKSTSSKLVRKTIDCVLRRKPSISLEPTAVVYWGALGVGEGSISDRNSGWMVSDFCYWVFLFCNAPAFDTTRSQFHVLRSLKTYFPDGFGVFGEAGCDRLRYPLHPSILSPTSPPDISAADFKVRTLANLTQIAVTLKSSELLVLLLIGHGSTTIDEIYHVWITTHGGLKGEDSFTKKQLESVVEGCKGRIVVICNACQSAHLASSRWTLVCAAGTSQYSDWLAQSGSGNVRGSMFTLCTTAQVAAEYGLTVPLPRKVKRPVQADELVALPPSPPAHTFALPESVSLPVFPPLTVPQFMDKVHQNQRYLLFAPTADFQLATKADLEHTPWTSIIPVQYTRAMVDATTIYPDNLSVFHELLGSPLHGGEFAHNPPSQTSWDDTLLIPLASAYVQLPPTPLTQEHLDARLCQRFLDSKNTPPSPSPFIPNGSEAQSLYDLLRRRNVQSIAVQEIAHTLGFWEQEIQPFVRRPGGDFRRTRAEMISGGMRLDMLPERLKKVGSTSESECMLSVEDPTAIFWLASKWVDAGRPVVSESDWDRAVGAAVASALVSESILHRDPIP
ncbi:hypothetical protein B0H12DRAFT_659124 [Mycena haematopus]|nr:hypothetical protein B0H12DRAFT_659124 [Mycena haematopus]